MDDRALSDPARPAVQGPRVPFQALCLRVILLDAGPPVWRRLRVPARMTLRRLHAVLRCALGRPDVEAHRFRVGDVRYGNTADALPTRDSRWTTVGEVAAMGVANFRYELPGPEVVLHEVRIEAILEDVAEDARVVCLAGEGVVPAGETSDGALEDRVHFMTVDPGDAVFDLDAINVALARLR